MSGEFDVLLERLAERVARRVCERLAAYQEVAGSGRSPWLGIGKAAEYLDWPKQRLYKLTAAGQIPHYKHEGRILFRTDELDHWLTEYAEAQSHDPERYPTTRATVVLDGNKDGAS
jgi:excisionase family DNA binding protein